MAQLQVTVVEGRNLKKKDFFSESDPFVRIYLDDKHQTQKTKVKSNTKNPYWSEIFVFNHLKGQNFLHIDVYDKDLLFNDKIGSLKINLQDLYENKHIDNWYNLPSRFGVSSNGEIHLILDYQPLQL
ncbi:unnamed protein product [Rotaria socialis]|uniref:C2 domain-containing protein n=1 Tax=Rotaria socialis TaxID=392032 RepID=A0A817N7C4_9BILA|nr:unnamed protein product [Rotaria socialis]CAF3408435.1 unnamed protein product [Rotaria socialis]CAF3502539.1 unnamed protein product [Rotaria socialis]CAF3526916.1 unnamed protein product [Rotaria socialis]CAF3770434.1 unnamed protein product [Rotaria socialis]